MTEMSSVMLGLPSEFLLRPFGWLEKDVLALVWEDYFD
jgi:hypothetical protein